MSDIVKPGRLSIVQHADGSVGAEMVVVDQKLPMGRTYTSRYKIEPMDLYMAMARASRDGMPMKVLRKEFGLDYHHDPKTGTTSYIDDRTIENALRRGRALLDDRIKKDKETAESVLVVDVDSAPPALTPADDPGEEI